MSPKGTDITPRSQKARAILALIATAKHHERSRSWLCAKLWSDRDTIRAYNSLRQDLRDIRRSFGEDCDNIITIDRLTVRLNSENVLVDLDHVDDPSPDFPLPAKGEFLEGIDIRDEEFEEWLSLERAHVADRIANASNPETRPQPVADKDPVQPFLAVMPIGNQSDLGIEDYVVDGLTCELVENLAKIKWMATIAYSSSHAFQNSGVSAMRFGEALDADYVVVGRIRKSSKRNVLFVELMDARSSKIVWSSSYELPDPIADIDISATAFEIAGNLDSGISQAEQLRANALPPHETAIRDLIWRGRWHLNQLSRVDAARSEQCFLDVLQQDPHNSEAYIQLAWSKLWNTWASRGSRDQMFHVREMGLKAIRFNSSDARGFWLVGTAESWLGNWNTAQSYVAEAIEIQPSLAIAHAQYGSTYILISKPEEALEPLQRALRLSPRDQQKFYMLGELAMAHWMLGDHSEAVSLADQSIMLRPKYWYAHAVRYLALSSRGNADHARQARDDLFRARPNITADDILWLPFKDRDFISTFAERLGLGFEGNMHRAERVF